MKSNSGADVCRRRRTAAERERESLFTFIYYFDRLPLGRADAWYTWLLGAAFKLPVEVLKIERDNTLAGSLHGSQPPCFKTSPRLNVTFGVTMGFNIA